MDSLLVTFVVGGICGLLLNVFYVTVGHSWPANYFMLSGSADPVISRNVLRFVVFRFAPPALVSLAAALTAERLDGSPFGAVAIALLVQVSRIGVGVYRAFQSKDSAKVVEFVIVAIGLIAISFSVVVIRQFVSGIIPHPRDLVANLWAAVLAAVGAVYIQRIALVRRDPGDLIIKSMEEIPEAVGKYALRRCNQEGVDPQWFFAVMCVENLQRPRWFRRAESTIPGWKSKRTLHIMQQRGAKSDVHSVDLALDNFFVPVGEIPVDEYGFPRREWLIARAREYNNNRDFANLVEAAFTAIVNEPTLLTRFATDEVME